MIARIGIDIAKNVFHVHGVCAAGKQLASRKLRRSQVLAFFGKLDPCLVGMEACAELLEAIVYNDDNLTYGAIISVYAGAEETITALTDDGIDELKDMLRDARVTTETWHAFLDDFVDDEDLVVRIKAQLPR